jgi:hypothetical protein
MLSKCANPSCATPFLYLHTGRLFRVERRSQAVLREGPSMSDKKISQSIEYYWLCASCSAQMTLIRGAEGGIIVRPLPPAMTDVAS